MENIEAILAKHGITDNADAVAKDVLANYRTIAEVDAKSQKVAELTEQLEQANAAIEAAKETDSTNAQQVEALQAKLAEYEQQTAAQAAQAREAQARAEFDGRFAQAIGDRKFANDIVRQAIADQAYETAKANPDMQLQAILDGIVKDADGIWENPQQSPKKMPAAGASGGAQGGTATVQTMDDLRGMTVDEIRARKDEVNAVLSKQAN